MRLTPYGYIQDYELPSELVAEMSRALAEEIDRQILQDLHASITRDFKETSNINRIQQTMPSRCGFVDKEYRTH